MAENVVESNRGGEHLTKNASENDPFASYRAPEFNAPAPGQAGKFVEWNMDLGKCSSMLHSMSLVGDFSTSTAKDNPNLLVAPTALSRMTQEDVNKCAANMPPSYYALKDGKGDVNYIGYRRGTPDFPNPIEHPFATAFFGVGIAAIKAYEGTKHLFTDDASIRIKDGHALYKAPMWYDIQDGSNKVKVKLAK